MEVKIEYAKDPVIMAMYQAGQNNIKDRRTQVLEYRRTRTKFW